MKKHLNPWLEKIKKKKGLWIGALAMAVLIGGGVYASYHQSIQKDKVAVQEEKKQEKIEKKDTKTKEEKKVAVQVEKKEEGKTEEKKEEPSKVEETKKETPKAEEKGKAVVPSKQEEKKVASVSNSESSNKPASSNGNHLSSSQNKSQSTKLQSSNSSGNKPAEKQKTWVPPVYETVMVPEEGHYEEQVVREAYENERMIGEYVRGMFVNKDTGERWTENFDTVEAWSQRSQSLGRRVSSSYSVDPIWEKYTEPAVVEKVWVVDKPAHPEKRLVKEGYWK